MSDPWESAFVKNQMMWGEGPTRSALHASERFVKRGVRDVLIPGVGYGRNAKPFLNNGMTVTGIEISATAIGLAREKLQLDFPIHHGSVEAMPFDDREYDGVFCYGLIYLLDEPARAKLIDDCHRQLRPGGTMIFTAISKTAPMYGRGTPLGPDRYEVHPGMKMFFYDAASVAREFGPYGVSEVTEIEEPTSGGGSFPFFDILCTKA